MQTLGEGLGLGHAEEMTLLAYDAEGDIEITTIKFWLESSFGFLAFVFFG